MNTSSTSDRADATVWLPLLHILGGVAERVARRRAADPQPDGEPPDGTGPAGLATGRASARGCAGKGGRP